MHKFCFGNWKLNTKFSTFDKFKHFPESTVTVGFAVSSPYIQYAKSTLPSHILVGAQDCSTQSSGAFTGETSLDQLNEFKINFILIGHSERRHKFFENNSIIELKLRNCLKNKIILCVGETKEERLDNKTKEVIKEQLSVIKGMDYDLIVAYEPVWAIGTGIAAQPKDVEDAVGYIKSIVDVPVLYGGSVDSKNASTFVPHCDGFLVGGASLTEEFFEIVKSLE